MIKNPPMVSIITPSYNQGRFIEDTILSVKNQDYPNIEHIIIDGGSTDNTLNILNKYKNTYNIRWISEPDKGQADAVNKGFRMAKGDFIGWINSDDCYFDVRAISSAVNYFNKFFDYDVIYGDGIQIDENNRLILILKSRDFSIISLKKKNILVQPSVLFRRCIIDQYGLDTRLECAMDYDLWLRISKNHKFKYINRIFAVDRIHDQRKTISKGELMLKESILSSGDYLKFTFSDRRSAYIRYNLRFIYKLIALIKIYYYCDPAFPVVLGNIVTAIRKIKIYMA